VQSLADIGHPTSAPARLTGNASFERLAGCEGTFSHDASQATVAIPVQSSRPNENPPRTSRSRRGSSSKVKNSASSLSIALLTLWAASGIAEQQPALYVYDAARYPTAHLGNPEEVRKAWDECHFLFSLQGVVNRHRPRLFVRYVNLNVRGKTINLDDYWLEKLRQPGEMLADYRLEPVESIEELVRLFRLLFRGVVCYDPNVPATSNVASTIAGVEDLPCLRYDPSPGSLYDRLVNRGPRLRVIVWLCQRDGSSLFTGRDVIPGTSIPSTGSAKCDAYIWAKEEYLDTGKCNPTKLAYYIDSYWLRNPAAGGSIANNTLSNHDYFISQRGFFFDLSPWDDEAPIDSPNQPPDADQKTLQAILLSAWKATGGKKMVHIGGFVPWAWKYTRHAGGKHDDVPTEWRFAQIASAYNAYLDADALDKSALVNASVYQHMKLDDRYAQRKPTLHDLMAKGLIDQRGKVAPKRYVCFYVGDYDSAAWLYQMMPTVWDDPARGTIPLGWAFNPNLADRMPLAMVCTRKTKSANDFFVAGDSGAGYVNPGMLQSPREFSRLPDGIDIWQKHCQRYYLQWDITVTGFVIDGYAPALSAENLRAYSTFSPDGIAAQKVPDVGMHDNMPIKRMDLDVLPDDAKQAAARILSFVKGEPPQFLYFRSILQTPTWHKTVFAELSSARDDFFLLDPYSFFLLLRLDQHE